MSGPFREQYRPIDPTAIAEAAADLPRLLVIEVIAAEGAEGARYGCRVLDAVAGTELAHHGGDADDTVSGELQALLFGLQTVAEIEPGARIVVKGTADVVARLSIRQLTETGAVMAAAIES